MSPAIKFSLSIKFHGKLIKGSLAVDEVDQVGYNAILRLERQRLTETLGAESGEKTET